MLGVKYYKLVGNKCIIFKYLVYFIDDMDMYMSYG